MSSLTLFHPTFIIRYWFLVVFLFYIWKETEKTNSLPSIKVSQMMWFDRKKITFEHII